MRAMDVVLYKMPIVGGQETVAEEWMSFLQATPEDVIHDMLTSEKAYYEAYFENVEQGTLYIYLVFSSENVDESNDIAFHSNHSVDQKHFDYMKRCVDRDNAQVLQSIVQLNRWQ
ncbi:MAG: DUF6176 family protein [Spirochaetales bacterium]|nr:DUF6176 family protein [Spirochaetales bacterium]